jgi:hypothetical protein
MNTSKHKTQRVTDGVEMSESNFAFTGLRPDRNAGSALVIVLAFLVLLTGLVVVFLGRALLDRKVSASSANMTKTEILGRGALNTIVADLKDEIAQNSIVVNKDDTQKATIYEPKLMDANDPASLSMMPARMSGTDNPNLIRSSDVVTPAYGFDAKASVVSSTAASANGRSIGLARWNSHYLLPLSGTSDSTPANFTAPDWVLVTGSGPQAITSLGDAQKSGGANQVIGRYAFAIYDEGGLVDANVAGYPSVLSGTSVGRKGSPALINLGLVISGSGATTAQQEQAMDKLVGWRNYATAQANGDLAGGYTFANSGSNYLDYILPFTGTTSGTVPGFLTVSGSLYDSRTDQRFTSRQALIKYQRAAYLRSGSTEFPPSSLQYLGTFSRSLNRPSFVPKVTVTSGVTLPAGNNFPTYSAQLGTSNAVSGINPVVQEVLAATGSLAGQPLVQQRFPLSRLGLFPSDPMEEPTSDQKNLISQYFGLVPVSGRHQTWEYKDTIVDASGVRRIRTLGEVAALNPPRDPNFFELLQAAILEGSLWVNGMGIGTANPNTAELGYVNFSNRASPYYVYYTTQLVFFIGANLIDQVQPHNFPITINCTQTPATYPFISITGVADLPYFSEMLFWPYRPTYNAAFTSAGPEPAAGPDPGKPASGSPDYREHLNAWLLFELWNPHQLSPTSLPAGKTPQQIRLVVRPQSPTGGATGFVVREYASSANPAPDAPAPNSTIDIYSNIPDGDPVPKGQPEAGDPSASQNYQPVMRATFNYAEGDYREPAIISGNKLAHDSKDSKFFQVVNDQGNSRFGLWIGETGDPAIGMPDRDYAVENHLPVESDFPAYIYGKIAYLDSTNTSVALQYLHPDGQWYYYQGSGYDIYDRDITRIPVAINQSGAMAEPVPTNKADRGVGASPWSPVKSSNYYTNFNYLLALSVQRIDPRCPVNPGRFLAEITPNAGIRPDATSGAAGSVYWPYRPLTYAVPSANGGTWGSPTPNKYYPGLYFENSKNKNNGNSTYLVDADGALRPGDGGFAAPSAYLSSGTVSRPVFLHRPFRSVAEMGYAFRGAGAWKSLNFFSPESADAGLLDYFSVDEEPVTAGKINLNTRQVKALQAALMGAYRDDAAGDYLTETDAGNLARAIINRSITNPLESRADLVRNLLADPAIVSVIDNIQGTVGGTSLNTVKSRREAFVRALGDVGTTRTWNLLIDVIVQSGQYARSANSLDQFTVEGEKRYWLHVAIDRYTGEVIDQQLEEVNE